MKPKSASIFGTRVSFPFLPLYLADLRYMIALAKEKGFDCQLSDDEHEYEDLDDLTAHCGNHVRKLSMKFLKSDSSNSDNVRVVVTYSGVALCADNGDEYVGLEQRMRAYLNKRAPWFAFAMHTWLWFPALGGLVPYILTRANQSGNPVLWRYLDAAFYFDIAMLLLSLVLPYLSGGVHLQRKHEVVGFFAKYEKMIIALIGALVGAVAKSMLDHGGLSFW